MKTRPGKHHLDPKWALDQLPGDSGVKWRSLFEHGTLKVEIYAPEGHDPQRPHRFDEVYVVISGRGYFRNGDERHPFKPGDLMFVPEPDTILQAGDVIVASIKEEAFGKVERYMED